MALDPLRIHVCHAPENNQQNVIVPALTPNALVLNAVAEAVDLQHSILERPSRAEPRYPRPLGSRVGPVPVSWIRYIRSNTPAMIMPEYSATMEEYVSGEHGFVLGGHDCRVARVP